MLSRLFFGGLLSRIRQLENRIQVLESSLSQLQSNNINRLNDYVEIIEDNNCITAQLSGLNLQIVNGEGSTNTTNCKGNLIIGYNEERSGTPVSRTGSHNLVLGIKHNYSSFSGFINGTANTITQSGEYCSILNGNECFANAKYVSICNGRDHKGNASLSTIVGGFDNGGTGQTSVVVGGMNNRADGNYSVILGGTGQTTINDQTIPPIS